MNKESSDRFKICILTAARSEYGLLRPIIRKMLADPYFDVRVAVTGMHLAKDYGYTYKEIEEDGIPIDARIPVSIDTSSPEGISRSQAEELEGFAHYFRNRRPDAVLILGDRYEILPVGIAAINEGIPIAHISGGDVTEGAVDDIVRHCMTKMSCLHFVASELNENRVIQMGEEPNRVFRVGSMSAECARSVELMDAGELADSMINELNAPANVRNMICRDKGAENQRNLAIVTFHPTTLSDNSPEEQCRSLLEALNKVEGLSVIFTKANSDLGGKIINDMIDDYVRKHPESSCAFTSLGQRRFLSAVALSDAVIGNSSSGLSEVPSLAVPTVDIGDRQKGREKGFSVISCNDTENEIIESIHKALSEKFRNEIISKSQNGDLNPYEKRGTSDNIVRIIKQQAIEGRLSVVKHFHML